MLRPVKIATSNSLGYLGLELGFAFEIQALDSESFYNFVSSSDYRSTWHNRAKCYLGLSCHRVTSGIRPRVWLGLGLVRIRFELGLRL